MDKKQVHAYIRSRAQTIIDVNDSLWEYAETAFIEYKSVDKLCTVLEQEGFRIEKGVGNVPTAFTATYGSGKPVIGLLAEYDALADLNQKGGCAVRENTSPEDAGKAGHGCGHNCFGAGVLGGALGLKAYLDEHPCGTVVVYGCPGEEGGSGKTFMAREGVFDDCDIALTWHPSVTNSVNTGSSLANYQVLYKFYGTPAHAAAAPDSGRSALDAVELMNTGVQYLREHMSSQARIHYAITNTGGFSPNVVQARADVLYLIRAPKSHQVAALYERVNKVAQGAAMMTETEVEIDFVKACSEMVKNETLEKVLHANMEQAELPVYTEEEYAFGKQIQLTCPVKGDRLENAVNLCGEIHREKLQAMYAPNRGLNDFLLPLYTNDKVSSGSTDVGDVSWVCPTAYFNATTTATGTPGHSWQFVACNNTSIAHKGVLYAAQVLAGATIDLLENPELREEAKAEHKKRLNGATYQCPIPAGVQPRAISEL